jgi:hypothetical protein
MLLVLLPTVLYLRIADVNILYKPDVQAGTISVTFMYSMPVDGMDLPHPHSVGILRCSRQNAYGHSSPSK